MWAAPIALTAFARTALLLKLRRVGRREGRYGVLIDSNSPHWQGYIEEHWLPRLGGRLAVLKYLERQHWDKRDLWVCAYVAFVKSDRARTALRPSCWLMASPLSSAFTTPSRMRNMGIAKG